MSRTKQEVRVFLDSLVGQSVNAQSGVYKGQCVSLIKALMEFLGVPDPYRGRGNAKDAGDTYIREGIGTNGKGWLTICVNRDMGVIGGVNYGHIWIDLIGETNYEQNGAQALRTTKGTRPISQAQQFVNFDKWITNEAPKPPAQGGSEMNDKGMSPNFIKRTYYMVNDQVATQAEVDFHMAKSNPESFINGFGDNPLWKVRTAERDQARKERDNLQAANNALQEQNKKLQEQIDAGGGDSGEFKKVMTAGTDLYTKS
jgi:hypothetical protein